MVIKVLSSIAISASFAILFQARRNNVLWAGLNGGVGCLIFLIMGQLGSLAALFLSSAAVAAYAEVAARLRKAPAITFLIAGLIPFVPGSGIYHTVLLSLSEKPLDAALMCYNTLLEAGTIAVGVIITSSLFRGQHRRMKSV